LIAQAGDKYSGADAPPGRWGEHPVEFENCAWRIHAIYQHRGSRTRVSCQNSGLFGLPLQGRKNSGMFGALKHSSPVLKYKKIIT